VDRWSLIFISPSTHNSNNSYCSDTDCPDWDLIKKADSLITAGFFFLNIKLVFIFRVLHSIPESDLRHWAP
jgi:hypothetical protein